MKCLICDSPSSILFEEYILGKNKAGYYCCESCGFIQTETPYWLDEAYKDAITFSDIGLVSRNINQCESVSKLILRDFNKNGKFLDFGGGYGLFVRLMRDAGFNFYRQDIFCKNIFAQNYDLSDIPISDNRFELVTSFEVFEHTCEPYKLLSELLTYSDNVLFSTLLVPEYPVKSAADWWYISPDTGQHVSFYTMKALAFMAGKFNLNLYSDGEGMHLFTKRKFDANPLVNKRTIKDRIIGRVINFMKPPPKKLKSLIETDVIFAKKMFAQKK